MTAMASPSELDLLLIGKTGNGKSHTGNSILKRKLFKYGYSSESVTTNVQYDVSDYNGLVIKVVDGPGVGDTRLDNVEATERVVNAMNEAIKMNPRGYHAFLLVISFGGRFTKEDVDTIGLLKKIFGDSFVRDFCILVMTFGDNFQSQSEETGESFEQWCQNQTGVLKQLLDECCGRIVLFNNFPRDEGEKDAQLDSLIAMVQGLSARGHRYTDNHFQQARNDREKAIIESKKPIISEASTQECSLILQEFERAREVEDPSGQLEKLNPLLHRTSTLLEKIRDEDKGTNALRDVEEKVKNIYQSINGVINNNKKVEREREELKRQEAEMKADMDKKMKKQQEEFNAKMDKQNKSWEERLKMQEKLERQRQEREADLREEMKKKHEKALTQWNDSNNELQSTITQLENDRIEMQRAFIAAQQRNLSGSFPSLNFVFQFGKN